MNRRLLPLLPLLSLLLVAAKPFSADLDGDGTPEVATLVDDRLRMLGTELVHCYEDMPCSTETIDIRKGDQAQELMVTQSGMRDEVSISLFTVRSGAVVPLKLEARGETIFPSAVVPSGTGILLADVNHRFYSRRYKFVLNKAGTALKHVPQPYWHVGYELKIDRSFPITLEAGGGGGTVANVRPGSTIAIVLESTDKPGNFLVRISSGLTGWASREALQDHSDHLMMLMSAG